MKDERYLLMHGVCRREHHEIMRTVMLLKHDPPYFTGEPYLYRPGHAGAVVISWDENGELVAVRPAAPIEP